MGHYEFAEQKSSANSSVDSETTLLLSVFSPHSWKQWGFYGRQSVLYMLPLLNVCMIVVVYQIPSQFLVCFLCSVEFGFFFMLADLSLLCHGSEVH